MIKKLSALLLALICAVSMTMPAFAAEHTEHGNVVNGLDPTCTEAGFIEYEDGCKIEIEATGHDYSSVTTVYHCIDQAEIKTYTCDTCGDTYDETIKATTGAHTWTAVDAVEATCQAVGNNGGKKCSECGVDKPDEVATEIPQRTHILDDANSSLYLYGSTESCNNAGNPIWKCKFCDYQYIDNAHSITEYCAVLNPASEYVVEKDAVAPSCFEEGKEADKYCKFCDGLAVTGAVIPATGKHDLKLEGKVEATCHSDGYTGDMVCQTEGCTYKELGSVDPATAAHNLKTVGAKEATCTEKGYTGDKVCQNDGCTYKELGTDIAIKPHNYEIHYVEEPTCAKEGYGYDKCKDCGYYDPETGHNLPAHSATLEVIPAVAPTCQETGLTEGKKCSKCEKTIEAQIVVGVIPCDQEVSIDAKAATCEEPGYEADGKKCSMCGTETVAPTVIPALGHLQDKEIPAKAPTCTEAGYEGDGKTCSRCGAETVAPTVVPALGHLQDEEIPAVEPTCTENGSEGGKKCSRCGEISLDPTTVPALGHLNDITLEAKAPTCTNTGLTAGVKCSRCNVDTTPQDVVPTVADAHVEKIIEAVEPTCTVPGATEGKVCSDCGLVLVPTTIIPSKGHTNAVIELVNCAENVEGYTVYKCEVCGEESRHDCAHEDIVLDDPADCDEAGRKEYACGYAYNIAALGHDKIITQAVAPTCTEKGATAGITCGRCFEVILTSTEIDELGHDIINHEAKEPTCTEIGWDAYETCSRCDHTTYVEKPALGHNLEDIPAVAATCISVGYTAGKGCTACDYIEVEPQVIPANGHSWVLESTKSIAPTCSRDGKEVYYCKDCGETVEKEVYATGNHNYVIVETQAATCTEQGYSKNRCTTCGDEFIAPALPVGHTESIDKGFAATCTAAGLTDGSHCGRCGDVLKEQVVIPAISHTPVTVKGFEATCTNTGLTDGTSCSVCGTVIVAQNVIPALGHTKVEIPAVEATCTKNGLTAGTSCSVCGDILEAQQIVYALGHKEVIVAGKAATCTATGLTEGKKCEVCNTVTVPQKVVPVVAHTITIINKKSATYTKAGYTGDQYCTGCKKVIKAGATIAKKTLKAPKIKITTSKRKINVTVSNVDKGATGFKIYYKKAGGSYKAKTYKSVKDLTKALTKLSSGKKYYVKVKVFVKSGSKTVYSKYSSVKTIKVK